MFGKDKKIDEKDYPIDDRETNKIIDRLEPDEKVMMSVRQSRVKPGGAAGLTPNTIFLTEKRVIIRNPQRFGLGENIEEYFYHQITNVRLEKGMFSASLVFAIPGMTELSKLNRSQFLWGRDSEGTIDAIPKDKAEIMYNFIRDKIQEAKEKKEQESKSGGAVTTDDPITLLKTRFVKGEITREEFEDMKKALE